MYLMKFIIYFFIIKLRLFYRLNLLTCVISDLKMFECNYLKQNVIKQCVSIQLFNLIF